MSQEKVPHREELILQLGRHLETCRAAGIEWLPLGAKFAPSAVTNADEPPAPASSQNTNRELDLPREEAPPTGLTLDQRRQELRLLAQTVSGCMRCPALASTRTQTVFGDGSPGAELCFIGEAPGADEDAQGLPFVGEAGQLLNRMIAAMGFKREEVYICNILRCRPPGNRTPLPNEADHCREYLERQIELVEPKFICTLGSCAAQNLLRTTLSVGRLRGKFHEYRGTPVLCTYHPAYLLPHRSPEKKKDVWEDLKRLLARMGRAVPKK